MGTQKRKRPNKSFDPAQARPGETATVAVPATAKQDI